jgi:hypothetical protein
MKQSPTKPQSSDRLRAETTYRPIGIWVVDDRKERFAKIVAFVAANRGFVTSIPGAPEVTIEVLPQSPIPAKLTETGYNVREIGIGQRIIAGTIVGKLTMTSSGALEPLIEGSTKAIAEVRRHSGICKVEGFVLSLP